MEIVGFIPARGASQGIARKNMRSFAGKPLVAWTIKAALASECTRVIVSTADEEIGQLAHSLGAEWLVRPTELDKLGEIAKTEAHALSEIEADYLVRLQPTSPLRIAADIDKGVELMLDHDGAVLGVTEARHHPYLLFWSDTKRRVVEGEAWERPRQEYRTAVWVNGAFYGAPVDYYERYGFDGPRVKFYHMPASRSFDLDSEFDWQVAEQAIKNTGGTWGS